MKITRIKVVGAKECDSCGTNAESLEITITLTLCQKCISNWFRKFKKDQ